MSEAQGMSIGGQPSTDGIVPPQGFQVAGVACGLKRAGQPDLSLIVGDTPCVAVGLFTQNRVVAAPVQISRQRVPSSQVRAVVINSANANACTGPQGLADADQMTRLVARQLGCTPEQVLVCSTGIIGRPLPMASIEKGIALAFEALDRSPHALQQAARAMMTTDRAPKWSGRQHGQGGQTIQVVGLAKGAGMIAPNLATMLAVILTDAALTPQATQSLLHRAVGRSFNAISVDGHTSTNDTVLLLASGMVPTGDAEAEAVARMVEEVCVELAQAIVRDGEGAQHIVTIEVTGLATEADARRVARTVADSLLVKTAIYGADPNWGRIISAVGFAGVDFALEEIRLWLDGALLFEAGRPVLVDVPALSRRMRENPDVHIHLQFQQGKASARFWTSDLTEDYIRINAEYTT